jgi:hypothetical protein
MKKPTVFALTLALLLLATAVGAQGSAAPAAARPAAYDYDPLTWTTVDGGGTSLATGGRYTLGLTSGQPDAGTAQGGRYTMATGFWDGLIAEVLHQIFVPLTLKGYFPPAPDLVVESITAAGNNVSLVLRNVGAAPAYEPFWVDVYIDPDPPPSAVNQPWQYLASQGLVWGVTTPAMPLAPGAAVTLTVGDVYFWPELSLANWPLPAGTAVYAQADSYNDATNYGAVLESHEITGGPYNNILGPVYVVPLAGEALGPALPGGQSTRPWGGLPARPASP